MKVASVGTALTDWDELHALSALAAQPQDQVLALFLARRGGSPKSCWASCASAASAPSPWPWRAPASGCAKPPTSAWTPRSSCRPWSAAPGWGEPLAPVLIVGWPWEGPEDYDELEEFLGRVVAARDAGHGSRTREFMRITLGASSLVPKPFTPCSGPPWPASSRSWRPRSAWEGHDLKLQRRALQVDAPFHGAVAGRALARGGRRPSNWCAWPPARAAGKGHAPLRGAGRAHPGPHPRRGRALPLGGGGHRAWRARLSCANGSAAGRPPSPPAAPRPDAPAAASAD